MRIFIIITTIILLSSPCFAFDIDYFLDRQETTARQACFIFMLYTDWLQTSRIDYSEKSIILDGYTIVKAKHCEKNKILGKYPKQSSIDIYFLSCVIAHTTISYILPEKYAKIWQSCWIGVQSKTLTNNYDVQNTKPNLEYKIEFKFDF